MTKNLEIEYEYNPYPVKFKMCLGECNINFVVFYGLSDQCPRCGKVTLATVTILLVDVIVKRFIYCRLCDKVHVIDESDFLPEKIRKIIPDFSDAARWAYDYLHKR